MTFIKRKEFILCKTDDQSRLKKPSEGLDNADVWIDFILKLAGTRCAINFPPFV